MFDVPRETSSQMKMRCYVLNIMSTLIFLFVFHVIFRLETSYIMHNMISAHIFHKPGINTNTVINLMVDTFLWYIIFTCEHAHKYYICIILCCYLCRTLWLAEMTSYWTQFVDCRYCTISTPIMCSTMSPTMSPRSSPVGVMREQRTPLTQALNLWQSLHRNSIARAQRLEFRFHFDAERVSTRLQHLLPKTTCSLFQQPSF